MYSARKDIALGNNEASQAFDFHKLYLVLSVYNYYVN